MLGAVRCHEGLSSKEASLTDSPEKEGGQGRRQNQRTALGTPPLDAGTPAHLGSWPRNAGSGAQPVSFVNRLTLPWRT